jgi:hypothetical protein
MGNPDDRHPKKSLSPRHPPDALTLELALPLNVSSKSGEWMWS